MHPHQSAFLDNVQFLSLRQLEPPHCFCPHSGQKLTEAGTLLLQFGHILSTITGRNKVPQKLQ